ncbi:3-methylfumaryl-CoA hydratase [Litoreibacter meonggei]|uniref:3-methylfumaryl-CoA hydratase n=1 Tax=Litoreibacter meonggei TaxID=1049199 RepID=A0A497VCX6_9RHOB|nr:acyl dehydratase [Litoreibacter meonggei]RLJ41142.1 3-methylfumaryl-CoA hydratase [Litoreibacter meonggei]
MDLANDDTHMTQDQACATRVDSLDPARISALAAALGVPDDRARPFWHQIYFWDARPATSLGLDGHPKIGALIPDMGLPRRMWAGGRLHFHAPPTPGQAAQKSTTLLRADRKHGRTGALGLVTLQHEISQDGKLLVSEQQDLIYRAADARSGTPPEAATDETASKTHRFTTTELFRYSALTFNGHRIHYDRDYALNVEGYDGLVVHGPLLAQYLMLMAEDLLGSLSKFDFRATAPLMDHQSVTFCAKPSEDGLMLWARADDGRQCMSATATS